MGEVEDFIYQQEDSQREVMLYLHQLFLDMNLVAKIRYRVPFYYGKSWVCYLNPLKKEGIELAFIRGNELSNEQGILDPKDRKQVAGIELYSIDDIPHDALHEVLQEAILLDETIPYRLKKK